MQNIGFIGSPREPAPTVSIVCHSRRITALQIVFS